MTAGIKANVDGSAAIQVGGTDVITLTSAGAATFVTSPTTVQAGTAAAPSITFSGDTNTGIYSPGADRIGFTEGGVQTGEFDASGNFLFNSGYGSVATAYGCRAWVNFNGAGTLTGTYSQSGTAITVTVNNHGLSQGQSVYITFQSGTASAEAFTVTSVTNANVFVVTSATSRTTSGNCTLATIIRASGNVSSITDNGTGDYTVNFTTAMPDANYAAVATSIAENTGFGSTTIKFGTTPTTSAVNIRTIGNTTYYDASISQVAIFR